MGLSKTALTDYITQLITLYVIQLWGAHCSMWQARRVGRLGRVGRVGRVGQVRQVTRLSICCFSLNELVNSVEISTADENKAGRNVFTYHSRHGNGCKFTWKFYYYLSQFIITISS